jgi:CHAD domain-containing protein
MTVNTTQTKARRHARDDAGPTRRPRPEQPSPEQPSPEQPSPEQPSPEQRSPEQRSPEQGPERAWPDHRDLPIAGTQPRRWSSAGDVVLAYLRTQAGALKSLEPMVRADEFDAVHQMRVTIRRLRATLRSFGQVIPRSDTERLAAELKWFGGLLGAARDSEVLPAHLQASLRLVPVELLIGPVQARVQGHFAPVRAAARAGLLEALDSARYAALLTELDRLAAGPLPGPQADDPARDVLPAAVRRAYRQADQRMRRARHTSPGQGRDVALHEARKSARRARYAAEAASPPIGKKARRFAKRMKKVQSVLGDHQDTVIARQAARDLGIGAHLAGENAFTYGLLYEREAHRAERLQADARKIWKRACRSRYRKWMK